MKKEDIEKNLYKKCYYYNILNEKVYCTLMSHENSAGVVSITEDDGSISLIEFSKLLPMETDAKTDNGALGVQVGGNHYKKFKIQPIEFIHKNDIPFIEGNVIKYICRWRDKNGIQDLEKAKHYIELLIDLEKNG